MRIESLGTMGGRYQVVVRDGVVYGVVRYENGSAGLVPWVALCEDDPTLFGADIEVDNPEVVAALFE